jgi:hypothetical protein
MLSAANETPEFRQNRDFAAAVKASGKPVELIEAANFNHFECAKSWQSLRPERSCGAEADESCLGEH